MKGEGRERVIGTVDCVELVLVAEIAEVVHRPGFEPCDLRRLKLCSP